MPAFRTIVLFAAVGILSAGGVCAQQSQPVPLPQQRPAVKIDKADKTNKTAAKNSAAPKTAAHKSAPLLIAPVTGAVPVAAAPASAMLAPGFAAPVAPSPPPIVPLAPAASMATSPMDLSAVKQAIDLVRKNRQDEASDVERTITDPVARKLVEWVILRSDNGSPDFSRYVSFIADNPSWPGIETLRRKAEGVLWQQQIDPQTVIGFFNTQPPHTTKGHFALARALLARGDTAGAAAALRDSWHKDDFSDDLEEQARGIFAGLITPADDEARMEARLYDDDDDAGLRAARHLNSPLALQVAKARAAVINDEKNAKALLDAVPEAGRRDPGYVFSRVQLLRRADKIPEAAQLLNTVPHDPAIGGVDQWWVERRLIARKLLDLGDARLAYDTVNNAAPPTSDNFRAEQHFTAGWIALRFLRRPELALPHFARVADGATSPITLARSFYWQARAEEALGREQDAAALYQEAARYSTAYYGQLARARLGIGEVTLRTLPAPPADNRPLEVGRALEILYAINEPDLIASMAAELGDKGTDAAGLAELANITTRHNDARATLLIGKSMLGRGYPFELFAFPVFGIPSYQQIGPPVEPCVVYSIARQESAFNPQVVSSANAIGLMQVTPEAGRDTAKKFGVVFDQRRLANDVVYNVQLGTAELGNNIASWNGSYILAFVAYNAGPRRAREWIAQYGDPRDRNVDPIDWIERIPISETRNYVQRILENMQVYRGRLGGDPRLSIEADLRRGG